MENIANKLLCFCKNKSILLYGTGRYAFVISDFLAEHGISIESCLVSNEVEQNQKFRNRFDVYSCKSFSVDGRKLYGIILALPEVYHEEVKTRIKNKFINVNTFPVKEEDIGYIRGVLWAEKRDEFLSNGLNVENEIYEINKFRRSYKNVALKFIDLNALGWYALWLYHLWTDCKEDTYYLYFPIKLYDSAIDVNSLRTINEFLTSKLVWKNHEVLSVQNCEFWKQFYQKKRDFFLVDDGCDFYDICKRFSSLLYELQSTDSKLLHDNEYIAFTESEKERGSRFLSGLTSKNIVCFHARDNKYKMQMDGLATQAQSLSSKYRNASIRNYRKSAEHLENNGMTAFRMGFGVEETITWDNTIDYASKYRTEFLDVYLASQCKFLVCTMNGITVLANLFSKPIVATNVSMLTLRGDCPPVTIRSRDLAIIKKFWWESKRRYLTFREMLERETDNSGHPLCSMGTFTSYERDGIVPVENTPEEIDDVVQEMVARLSGTMVYTEEDKRLQQKYFDLIDSYPMNENFPYMWSIGTKFLRENQWLLD